MIFKMFKIKIKYKMNKEDYEELIICLNDLHSSKIVEAQSLKIKKILFDLGYMVEKKGYTVYPITCH